MDFKNAKECHELSLKNKEFNLRNDLIISIALAVERGEFYIRTGSLDDELYKELIESGYEIIQEEPIMGQVINKISWEK